MSYSLVSDHDLLDESVERLGVVELDLGAAAVEILQLDEHREVRLESRVQAFHLLAQVLPDICKETEMLRYNLRFSHTVDAPEYRPVRARTVVQAFQLLAQAQVDICREKEMEKHQCNGNSPSIAINPGKGVAISLHFNCSVLVLASVTACTESEPYADGPVSALQLPSFKPTVSRIRG